MLLNWLEQRLEYTQRKRLRKLISNLTEIVYVNALLSTGARIDPHCMGIIRGTRSLSLTHLNANA